MESWEKIIKLREVDSTNNYLSKLLKESHLAEGSIVSALYQSKGKGHGTNSWESEKGQNILISLILHPHFLPIDKNFLLSKAVSLGIANYTLTKSNYIKIKWPNDIYFKDKKLAGILIENTIQGDMLSKSIVGIGLNINQTLFTSDAPNPVSLKQITNKTYSVDQEIIRLRNSIRFFYEKLKNRKFTEINSDYLKCLYRYNETHTFKKDNELFKAKITGISDFGYLQLLTEHGKKLEFDFKEIEFMI